MTKEVLQQKIEARAQAKVNEEYKKLIEFMMSNKLCRLLKFKKCLENGELIPFLGHHSEKPLFVNSVHDKMETAANYTNFNDAKKELFELFVEIETNQLLQKIDTIPEYTNEN